MKHQKTIEQELHSFIKENNLLSDAKKILLALSGGADSVFMLHFFNRFKEKYKIKIAAIHVNHNLRGNESQRDENFCKYLCERLNIEFHLKSVDVKKNKGSASIEEAARNLRYKEIDKILKSSNSDLIATAHTRDDNTETVLLNIFNGTGLKGLTGIPVKRDNIIRPILTISKSEILNYLNEDNIAFIQDSSNENVEFRRNFLRKKIIHPVKEEINPSLDKIIFNSSLIFKKQMRLIDFFTEIIVGKAVKFENDKALISIKSLKKYPEEIIGEVLNKILTENFGVEYSFKQYKKVKSLISGQVGKVVEITKDIKATRERELLVISKEKNKKSEEIEIRVGEKVKLNNFEIGIEEAESFSEKFKNNSNVEFIDGKNIENPLVIRRWKRGDKIQLLGMKGTKKISDVLTDIKIPTLERKEQLVLTNKDEIVWLIGKKLSEKYKITAKTKKILRLWIK